MALTAAQLEANRLQAAGLLSGDAYIKAYFGGAADPTKYSDAVQQKYGIGNYATLADAAKEVNAAIAWDKATKNVTVNNNTYTPDELRNLGGNLSPTLDRWILPNDSLASLLAQPIQAAPHVVASKPYNPPAWTESTPTPVPAPIVQTSSIVSPPPIVAPPPAPPVVAPPPAPVTPPAVVPPPAPVIPVNQEVIEGVQRRQDIIVPTQMGELKRDGGIDPNRLNLNNLFKNAEDTEDPNDPQRTRIKDASTINKLDSLPKRGRKRGELGSLLQSGSGLMTGR